MMRDLAVAAIIPIALLSGTIRGVETESKGLPAPATEAECPSDATRLVAPGAGLGKWRADQTRGWETAATVSLDENDPRRLAAKPVQGGAVLHNTAGDPSGKKGSYLFSVEEHGDVEAHVEFLMAKGSNSGVYFMGRYEIQLFDSYGIADDDLTHTHCGGVYQRWDNNRNPKGFDGVAASKNASRPAGQWQSLDVVFRAPRFDADGKKTEDARFVRVVHNGVVIHENVSCSGPTRAARFSDEAPEGPLVLQGDHGPVAFRNLWMREE